MASLLTASNIMFGLGLLGALFTVYNYFRNPQIASDKEDALMGQRMDWQKESNNQRFEEMGKRMTDAMSLAQNHIHTIDTKVENLNTAVGSMGIEIARLATIIEERIPKR